MKLLARWFVQGLLVLVPVVVTGYVIWAIVVTVDGWFPLPVAGLGVVAAIALILATGLITSGVVGRKLYRLFDALLERLPIVKLLYTALRDLMNAFMGDKKGFRQPVVVELGGELHALGFLTCERFEAPGLADYVGVYLPQSYNVAGNFVLVSRSRVRPVEMDAAQLMAFVMSGGVSTARTHARSNIHAGTRKQSS
jgi:uncharacterized membrane protein